MRINRSKNFEALINPAEKARKKEIRDNIKLIENQFERFEQLQLLKSKKSSKEMEANVTNTFSYLTVVLIAQLDHQCE